MNKPTKQYRKKLQRALKCCREEKQRFLEKFQKALDPFLEENPDPSQQDLTAAFGPPEEMARLFLGELTEQDHKKYRTRKWILVGVFAVILVAAVALAVRFLTEKPEIIYVEEKRVIGETIIVEDEPADSIEE